MPVQSMKERGHAATACSGCLRAWSCCYNLFRALASAVNAARGDPKLVADVADGLPFKYRYTSGVFAWSAEDAPTEAQIERFVEEFEKTAWSGLDPERYVWSAVAHRDDAGGVHVHTFAARCDLATGRSLNIAPPGWQEVFDPLRDAFNYTYGWSRPDDPARARPSRPAPGRVHQGAGGAARGEGCRAGCAGGDRETPAGARGRRQGQGPRRDGGGAGGVRLRGAPPRRALRDGPEPGTHFRPVFIGESPGKRIQ